MINDIKIQLILGGLMVLLYPLLRKHGVVKMFWVSFVIAYLTAFVYIYASPLFHGIIKALTKTNRFKKSSATIP